MVAGTYYEYGNKSTILNNFRPMGAKNKPIPTGKWYFSFQFSNTTEQGREQHEALQDLIDDSETQQLTTGF